MQVPACRFQILTVLSDEPETTNRPSCVICTEFTWPEWPANVFRHSSVSRFQMRIVWSKEADAARFSSLVTSTQVTALECPTSVARHSWLGTSQILSTGSLL